MEKSELCTLQNNTELDKDITFEVSKDVKITTKISFKKRDVIEQLLERISNLEREVKILNKNSPILSEDTLTKLWDNEDDRRWNNV